MAETYRRATNCADAALRRRRRTAADTDTELSEREKPSDNIAVRERDDDVLIARYWLLAAKSR